MAATPAWVVASLLVVTTKTLYLRSGGGAFLLLLPADAAAGSVRARTARADPTTLVHLTLDRIRAASSPGIPGLLGCGTVASGAPLWLACLPCAAHHARPNLTDLLSYCKRSPLLRGRSLSPPAGTCRNLKREGRRGCGAPLGRASDRGPDYGVVPIPVPWNSAQFRLNRFPP